MTARIEEKAWCSKSFRWQWLKCQAEGVDHFQKASDSQEESQVRCDVRTQEGNSLSFFAYRIQSFLSEPDIKQNLFRQIMTEYTGTITKVNCFEMSSVPETLD